MVRSALLQLCPGPNCRWYAVTVLTLVAHNAVIGLLKEESKEGFSSYQLRRNNIVLGQCEFPSYVTPKFSVSKSGSVAIYGGCSVYLLSNEGKKIYFEEREEVNRIWFIDCNIFLSCDTLISSRKEFDASINNEYFHEEIIVFSELISVSKIAFFDLQNHVFEINLEDFFVKKSNYPFVLL